MTDQIETILQAIKAGDQSSISKALEETPSLASAKTEQGVSLLMMATYYRNPVVVDLFRQKRTELDLHEASAIGDLAEVNRHLANDSVDIDAPAADGFGPLGLACFFGQAEVAKRLVEAGADVDLPANNPFKVRPLHSAAASKHLEIAKLLLEKGADPSAAQMQGVTPLHSAAHNGQVEMVRLLLEYGANAGAKTDDGKTPLDMAREDGHEEVVGILSD